MLDHSGRKRKEIWRTVCGGTPAPLCLMAEEKVSETSHATMGKRHWQLFVLPPCTLKTHRARLCAPLIETGIEVSLDLT